MRTSTLLVSLALTLVVTACNASHPQEGPANTTDSAGTPTTLAGRVTIDGSSTVLPVSTVLADAFHASHPKVEISVHESGTAGGFRKFCAGEIDITGASRPINASEIAACDSAGVELIELPFAFDSLAVVRNPANAFATCLTIGELRTIWQPEAERRSPAGARSVASSPIAR
jgi:phosphate transport system substrate-binding protein